MMLFLILLVSVISYSSAQGEYGAPRIRPKYRFPMQHRPEVPYEMVSTQYEAQDDSPYKYAPFVDPSHYGPQPPQSATPAYGDPSQNEIVQYAPATHGGPPSQYGSPDMAEEDDPYKGLRPDQVPLPKSAGVHDGGAEIPGLGFVKGYPFTQLYQNQEGYDIPGLGFIAGYPFTQLEHDKPAYDIPGLGLVPGYPFSYIGPYVPKSDPQKEGYDDSDYYRQASPEDPYAPQAVPSAQSYTPETEYKQGTPADSYSQQAIASPVYHPTPKNIPVQYSPSSQTGYLSQPLSYPQDDPYMTKETQEPEYALAQDAYADPSQKANLGPVRYPQPMRVGYPRIASPNQYAQSSPDGYAQSGPVGYARHPSPLSLAANHIPPNVHLPKFIMNPPTAYKGSAGPQYH